MTQYIILSRFSPTCFQAPSEFRKIAEKVSKKIREECPGIEWEQSYVTMGQYDVIDIVSADDRSLVEKAAMIIRGFGGAVTETMPATPWKTFLERL